MRHLSQIVPAAIATPLSAPAQHAQILPSICLHAAAYTAALLSSPDSCMAVERRGHACKTNVHVLQVLIAHIISHKRDNHGLDPAQSHHKYAKDRFCHDNLGWCSTECKIPPRPARDIPAIVMQHVGVLGRLQPGGLPDSKAGNLLLNSYEAASSSSPQSVLLLASEMGGRLTATLS